MKSPQGPNQFLGLNRKSLPLIAVFAALQAIVAVIPFSMTIGVSGAITLGVVTAPLFGLLLGPPAGFVAVAIGSLVGLFLNPSGAIFGPLTILPPALAALGTGSVKINRGYIPAGVILISVAAFYLNPIARESLFYPWLHIIALILAFSPLSKLAASFISASEFRKNTLGVAFAALVGTLTDHAFGSAMGIWYYSLPAEVWNLIMYVYPVERIVAVILVVLIGVPVYRRLRTSGMI